MTNTINKLYSFLNERRCINSEMKNNYNILSMSDDFKGSFIIDNKIHHLYDHNKI